MNLPTKFTVLRIFMTLIIIFILLFPFSDVGFSFPQYNVNGVIVSIQYVIAGVLFILASITDFIDGKLARKYNMVTDLGKMLDSIADKILVNSVLVILACQGFIYPAIAVIIVLRDIVVDAIKMQSAGKGKVVAAIYSGKIKTASLMVGIVLAFFYNIPFAFFNLDVQNFMLLLGAVMSLISAYQYWRQNKALIIEQPVETLN